MKKLFTIGLVSLALAIGGCAMKNQRGDLDEVIPPSAQEQIKAESNVCFIKAVKFTYNRQQMALVWVDQDCDGTCDAAALAVNQGIRTPTGELIYTPVQWFSCEHGEEILQKLKEDGVVATMFRVLEDGKLAEIRMPN